MKSIKTIGIIGLGSFGTFTASLIPRDKGIEVIGTDIASVTPPEFIQLQSLEQVCRADVIIMAIPLHAYESVLTTIRKNITADTLLIDVCSVKVKPEEMITAFLPDHQNLLLTHPLFGPLTTGKKIVVTKTQGELAGKVVGFCQSALGLEVLNMTSQEHDKAMADIHVLSFFVARGLANIGIADSPIATPTYKMLLDLVNIDHAHSEELFLTVQNGNPYADEVRQKLVQSFADLENNLKGSNKLR